MGAPMSLTDFADLRLRKELVLATAQMGFLELTPIQAESLPPSLAGKDVVGQAKTGSGKTAAFALAMLHPLDLTLRKPQGLVLCPTRELADQVAGEIRRLAGLLPNTRVVTTCGGRPYYDQKRALNHGAHIVVGTPGRVAKHLRNRSLATRDIRCVVLDEADRLLDMGFTEEVEAIVEKLPKKRQTLLFSATYPEGVDELSKRLQTDPVSVGTAALHAAHVLRQEVVICEPDRRDDVMCDLLVAHQPPSTLVFCETRAQVDNVARMLHERGAEALALHGDMEQRDRDSALARFTNGSTSLLVATNVAARGLDVDAIGLVLIYEVSPDPSDHVHRIGRTGRAGLEGLAITLVAGKREQNRLEAIEAHLGAPIPRARLPGLKPTRFVQSVYRTVLVFGGRSQKLRPGDILGAVTKDGAVPGDAVGKIAVFDKITYVAIARAHRNAAVVQLRTGKIKGRRFRAEPLG
jgi:ATP-independent RNA helicase DbpA